MNTQDHAPNADEMFHDAPQGLGDTGQVDAIGAPAVATLPAEVKPKGKSRDLTKKPLVTIDPDEYVAQVYAPFHEELAKAIAEAASTDYDVTTTAGMKVAGERRRVFRAIRTASENARKERKAPILQIGKLLDSRQKEIEAKVLPYEEAHDKIIKAEEARKESIRQEEIRIEQERVNNITAKIEKIAAVAADLAKADAQRLLEAVTHWREFEVTGDEFEEFQQQAEAAVTNLVGRLDAMYEDAVSAEQRQREEAAARQREKEERERIAAALAEERRKAAERDAELAAAKRQAEAREAHLEAERKAEREAAARREAAMAEQMAEMQRQLAAAQAKPEEPPAEPPAPAEVEPDPSSAPAMAWPEPFPGPAAVATVRPAAVHEQRAPSAGEIVDAVASHFEVDEATAREWLRAYDFAELSQPAAAVA